MGHEVTICESPLPTVGAKGWRYALSTYKARGCLVTSVREFATERHGKDGGESFVSMTCAVIPSPGHVKDRVGAWEATVGRFPCARATQAAIEREQKKHLPEARRLVAERMAAMGLGALPPAAVEPTTPAPVPTAAPV